MARIYWVSLSPCIEIGTRNVMFVVVWHTGGYCCVKSLNYVLFGPDV